MGPGRKKRNIGSTVDSCLLEEGSCAEVSAKALKQITDRRNESATSQNVLSMSKVAMTYKSEARAAIHESASALYRIGAIDKKMMREFDAACIEPSRKPARNSSK